ncbi:PAS domain S-box protein [Luteolibacter luteus]|uniref:histidine kinase n=1 Tax=Luteolibacter luteus TaxID=2728835 RepID=A0A858RP55_9BACT|nr:PAS domain S-box protein [Luteolibacter luteus]QJE98807.1 PAS domain S-box protein [Luteolibacter luteus]
MKNDTGTPATNPLQAADWFRMFFERSTDPMALLDPVTTAVIDCNAAAVEVLGVNRKADLIGRSPVEFSPEDQPGGQLSDITLREAIRQTIEKGGHRFEWQVLTPRGDTAIHDIVATALPSEGRTLIHLAGRDMGEAKRVEAELRLSDSRWRRAFEQSPISIQVFAPDGTTLQINQAYRDLFQLDMEDLVGHSIRTDSQLKEAGLLPLIERAFNGQVTSIDPIPFELKALPDQVARGVRWIGSTMFPVFDARNNIVEVVCIHQDKTAVVVAEAEIRELNQSLEARIAERTAELQASEERFKRLFEFSPLGIGLVDEHGNFQQTNSAFAEMLGYTTEELNSKNYWDINRIKHFAGQRTFFDKLQGAGRFGPYEKEYICKDGSSVPVLLHGMRTVSSNGEVQIWGIAQDISLRKQAERALRESEEKFKALFEFSPLGMARVSWDGQFLQVNESFARMIGRTVEDVHSLTYWDVTPRKYEEQEIKILETVREHGTFGPFEKEYIHKEGHLVPIVLSGMLITSPDGDEQLWGIAVDTTERTRAEKALRDSERKFRTLFEGSSQGVMIHENELFSDVNPAAAKIFGRTVEEIIGTHPADYATEYQPDGEHSSTAASRHLKNCLEDGSTHFEWSQRHVNGHDVLMEVVLTRIPAGDKDLIQAVVTDISERKRAELEMKRALERERELNQLKNNFVSMVSHEFRTPLGIIQSSAEILADYLDRLDAEERHEQLQSIIKNSRRMAGLMEDVLLLGRLDAGRMKFVPRLLDLAALCRGLVDEINSTTSARCPIEFFTSNLPSTAQADERLLRHVLINLLSNAVKYSEEGQPVAFRATGMEGAVRFEVQDHGIGIPEDELAQLFAAFQRGSNVGQRPGTGLGLVIVKQSAELHGGTIEVESHLNSGTTVIVTIPLTQ